jgi:hypothetical protein
VLLRAESQPVGVSRDERELAAFAG